MLDRFWELQKLINKAIEDDNENLIEKYGDEQDECVKKMSDKEYKELLSKPLPVMYKNYIKKLRG